MTTTLDSVGPLLYRKFSQKSPQNPLIRVSQQISLRRIDTWHPCRVSLGFSKRESIIRATNSSEEDKEETETNNDEASTESDPRRLEREDKEEERETGGGWRPQISEMGSQFFQMGVLILFMKLLGVRGHLPGCGPIVTPSYKTVPYSEFLNRVGCDEVRKVEIDDVNIMFKLKPVEGDGVEKTESSELGAFLKDFIPGKKIVYTTTRPVDVKAPYEKMLENSVEFGSPDKRSGGFFNYALAFMICAGALTAFLPHVSVSLFKQTTGKLQTPKSGGEEVAALGGTITFADVAGVDEVKEELEEIVEFLRNPSRYTRLGARPPRGVLLVGLPGTGKTLLAKAVAGEANVPFISCSGSEFVELYVGVGALRVRELFARAKRAAPCIIFIDEIDAVAKIRDGKYRMGSNDEREQTLNQLLTEMDGFDSSSAVIVLGATNRADVLDPALRRPGRFDRVVMVETPDRIGRESILGVHVSKKELPLAEDIDLSDIASMTTGFTGADLANLVNEAALLAGRESKIVVEKIDFINAVERSLAGIEKKTAKLQGIEKGVVARHEAGHAVVGTAMAKLLPGQPRVEKLSILPRSGGTLGFAYTPPATEDRYLLFVDELRGRLVTLLGGRAAEEIIYAGRVSTGAMDDIRRATDIAYKAIAEYGLSQTIGPISLTSLSGGGDGSGGTMPWGRDQGQLVDLVQGEVKALLQSALEVALLVVRANATILEGLGAYLEEKEKVEGEDLQEWLKLVVAPTELKFFISGKQPALLEASS